MSIKRSLSFLVLSMAVVGSPAWAERMDGEVTGVNVGNRIISISRVNTLSGRPESMDVVVPQGSDLGNAGTLENVQVGKSVQIDASKNKKTGQWEAKSVQVI